MSRFALVGKEVRDLVVERRLLVALLLVSLLFSTAFGLLLDGPAHSPASPLDFLDGVRLAGPGLAALLAVAMAGDAVSRERQDRTLALLFTAPATKARYWAALLAAHALAFAALLALLLLFALLAGSTMGWVAAKGMPLLGLALLPLFLTLDLLVLACSARMSSGRASLLLALALVLAVWASSLSGPLGGTLRDVPWWSTVSAWHPFDLADAAARTLLEGGALPWRPLAKAAAEAALAAAASWASIAKLEVGR